MLCTHTGSLKLKYQTLDFFILFFKKKPLQSPQQRTILLHTRSRKRL
jgi:hypothetical protein